MSKRKECVCGHSKTEHNNIVVFAPSSKYSKKAKENYNNNCRFCNCKKFQRNKIENE